jgi:hypothetical protein
MACGRVQVRRATLGQSIRLPNGYSPVWKELPMHSGIRFSVERKLQHTNAEVPPTGNSKLYLSAPSAGSIHEFRTPPISGY